MLLHYHKAGTSSETSNDPHYTDPV